LPVYCVWCSICSCEPLSAGFCHGTRRYVRGSTNALLEKLRAHCGPADHFDSCLGAVVIADHQFLCAHLGANGQRFYHYLDLAATDVGCLSLGAASDRRYCFVDRDRYRRWVAGGFVPLVAPVDGT